MTNETFWLMGVVNEMHSEDYKPKHMPHNPVSKTSRITQSNSPRNVSSKTEKLKIRTSVVWKHITRNCVVTCEANISTPVTPETRHRSKIPSFRSINMAPDVRATDKKKMMLQEEGKESFSLHKVFRILLRHGPQIDESLFLLQRHQSRVGWWLIKQQFGYLRQLNAGRSKVGEVGNAVAVDGLLPRDWNAADGWVKLTRCQNVVEEIKECVLNVTV